MDEWSSGRITALRENHHVPWTGFVGAEGRKRGSRAPVPHAVDTKQQKTPNQ